MLSAQSQKRRRESKPPSSEELEEMRALGLKTDLIEQSTYGYTRRPKGKILHHSSCVQIRRAQTVRQQVTLADAWQHPYHECTGWHYHDRKALEQLSQNRDVLGILDEIGEIEKSKDPMPSRARALRVDMDADFKELLEERVPAELVQDMKKRLAALNERWGDADLVRSFVVETLTWPRNLVSKLEADGKGIGRLLGPVWSAWSEAVAEEMSREKVRSSAKNEWDNCRAEMIRKGEEPIGDEYFDTAIREFERHLGKSCKRPGVTVLVAYREGGWSAWRETEMISRAERLFPSQRRTENGLKKIALAVPEVVAESLDEHLSGKLVWLGRLEENAEAVLETFITLWNPRTYDSSYEKACAALEAAKELV